MDDRLRRCFGGAIPPIATPLTDQGDVDHRSLLALRDRLIHGGVTGVFALGSTGEASYLDSRQRHAVVDELARAARDDGLPLLVGVVEPTAARVTEAIERLPMDDVTALVVTGPFYARASDAEIASHFELIARASPVPVLAYNIPVNVGYALPGAVLHELIAKGVVAGMKDSSTDLAGLRTLVMSEPSADALYFSGSDGMLDLALAAGANGSVAGLGNVAPQWFVRALAAHAAGDHAALAEQQRQITRLAGIYGIADPGAGLNSTQLGSVKTALMLLGVIASDRLSAPMRASSADKRDLIRELLSEIGLLD
jgi:4-hydroxy-tetrahydrodipicolinate synthase